MPKVSVVLPCYNVEKYIAKSIESVLKQTFTNFELLVVIDGSPDKSQKIAASFSEKDSRIQVLVKENGGLSDARNYGLERAKGEFVYFMDSDDWIEPNLLEDNLIIIEEEELDYVIFGYVQDNEGLSGEILSSDEIVPKVTYLSKGDKNLSIDIYQLGLLGYAWNKIYRKSFLDNHKFRFEKGVSLVEDILFNAPIFIISDKIRFNTKCYYHYINRDEITLMKSFHENSFELKVKKNIVLEQFLTAWKVKNKKEILADSLFLGLKYCIVNLVKSNTKEEQKLEYLKVMCSHPRTVELLKEYKPTQLKDRALRFLISSQKVRMINFLRKVK